MLYITQGMRGLMTINHFVRFTHFLQSPSQINMNNELCADLRRLDLVKVFNYQVYKQR